LETGTPAGEDIRFSFMSLHPTRIVPDLHMPRVSSLLHRDPQIELIFTRVGYGVASKM
jgi:hypothetical protein